MFNRSIKKPAIALAALMLLGGTGSALAYSCEGEFAKADALIKEAEGDIKPDTDARIKAMLAEAKGSTSHPFESFSLSEEFKGGIHGGGAFGHETNSTHVKPGGVAAPVTYLH